jgi:hypothetical protein
LIETDYNSWIHEKRFYFPLFAKIVFELDVSASSQPTKNTLNSPSPELGTTFYRSPGHIMSAIYKFLPTT